MMRGLVVSILIVTFCTFSCNTYKYKKKNMIFKNYLMEMNYFIPEQTHYFIIAPNVSCHNCIKSLCNEFTKSPNILGKNNLTFISSNRSYLTEAIIAHKNFLFDSLGAIDYLDLGLNNLTIIETNSSRIQSIKSISTTAEMQVFINEITELTNLIDQSR